MSSAPQKSSRTNLISRYKEYGDRGMIDVELRSKKVAAFRTKLVQTPRNGQCFPRLGFIRVRSRETALESSRYI